MITTPATETGSRKQIWVLIGVIIGGLTLGVLYGFGRNAIATPVMRVETDSVDLGTTAPGALITRSIRLWNAGVAPLHITRIQTSCGCTAAQVVKSILSPGEETILSATVKARSIRGPGSVAIDLYSNDPRQPMRRVVLGFTTGEDTYLEPSVVDLGMLAVENLPMTKTTRLILAPPGSELGLDFGRGMSITSDSPNVVPTIADTSEANIKTLSLCLQKGAPIGQVRATLHVRDREQKIDLGLNVHATVRGRFRAAPSTLILGPVSPAGHDERLEVIVTGPLSGFRIDPATVGKSLAGLIGMKITQESPTIARIEVNVQKDRLPEVVSRTRYSDEIRLACRADGVEFAEWLTIPVVLFVQPNESHRIR